MQMKASCGSVRTLLVSLVLLFATAVSSTALSFRLEAHGEQCFFTWVGEKESKVAFYFAVQSGGSFDVNYHVVGPSERPILEGERERQGDYVFTANEIGEYKFCFNNEMSTVTEKLVDFEITVENEVAKAELPTKPGAPDEQTSTLTEGIYKISSQLSSVARMQKYFRTRENRNFSTVKSTEQRIFKFSIYENLCIVGMAGLQVFVVRFFFTGARKGFV